MRDVRRPTRSAFLVRSQPIAGPASSRVSINCPPPMARLEEKQTLSREQLLTFLDEMLVIRRVEEQIEEQYMAGEIPGFVHVAIGQEGVAVGVCQALELTDVIASTHRSHAHTLAKGTPPRSVMAEMYGKREGCSKATGGPGAPSTLPAGT